MNLVYVVQGEHVLCTVQWWNLCWCFRWWTWRDVVVIFVWDWVKRCMQPVSCMDFGEFVGSGILKNIKWCGCIDIMCIRFCICGQWRYVAFHEYNGIICRYFLPKIRHGQLHFWYNTASRVHCNWIHPIHSMICPISLKPFLCLVGRKNLSCNAQG